MSNAEAWINLSISQHLIQLSDCRLRIIGKASGLRSERA